MTSADIVVGQGTNQCQSPAGAILTMENFFFTFAVDTGYPYDKVVLSVIYNEQTGGYDYGRTKGLHGLYFEYDNLAKFKAALKGYIKRLGTPLSVSVKLTDPSERGRERYTQDFLQYFMD